MDQGSRKAGQCRAQICPKPGSGVPGLQSRKEKSRADETGTGPRPEGLGFSAEVFQGFQRACAADLDPGLIRPGNETFGKAETAPVPQRGALLQFDRGLW